MPKPRVYVETTIPSFYYDTRQSPAVVARREATREWWAGAAQQYELVTSPTVWVELLAGEREELVRLRTGLLAGIPLLLDVPAISGIVETYLRHRLMPAKPTSADAVHLALASYYGCDLIATWNCRHLANPRKATHILRINTALGLHVPSLRTPRELLGRSE